MNLLIYILAIILIVVLLIYLICFDQFENNSKLGYWFKGSKLKIDLDIDNIIIDEIRIVRTNTEIFKFMTKTLCHYDIMLKDVNGNYYIYYVYHDGDYYNRYAQMINIDHIQNNQLKFNHKDDSWIYKISRKKYDITPISFRRIDWMNETLFNFGYHLSKFNCQHRTRMLINILRDESIYDVRNYPIFNIPFKILFELFSKLFK